MNPTWFIRGKIKNVAKKFSKKQKLTKAIIVSLGIPGLFVPGMILAAILGWNWQRDLVKLVQSGGFRQSREIFPRQAVAKIIKDGDTIELDNGMILRFVGIDAPNRGEPRYEEVTEYVRDLIEGETIYIEYDAYQEDKFGRLLGYVFEKCQTQLGCKDGKRMINWLLVKKGLARVETYKNRRPLKYEKLLRQAEEESLRKSPN